MKEIKAIVRQNRLDGILDALYAHPRLPGVAISQINVFGRTAGRKDSHGSSDLSHELVSRAKIECVIDDAHLEEVLDLLKEHAHTGIPGDGVITVSQVHQIIRIRTGERSDHVV